MKITRKHKEVFRKTLDLFIEQTYGPWICPTMWQAAFDDWKIYRECRTILFDYFKDPNRDDVLWFRDIDGTKEELFNARIIALYTLIYAPL